MRISPVVSRYFFIFVASGSWEEARPLRIQRRNSDSSLYCKTPFGEGLKQTLAPTERPPKRQSRYLDPEKERFIQSFLKTTEDTSSVTDESSDSGMPGTHSALSDLGTEETSGKPEHLTNRCNGARLFP